MAKLTYSNSSTIYDKDTGEVQRYEESNTIRLPEEPPYVKLYLDDIVKINDLPKSSSKVLYELVRKINYDGQIIINASVKRMISARIGVKEHSISNAITGLIAKDIMHRIDTGVYVFNPALFAKGAWVEIRKLREKYLELKITYSPDGKRKITSSTLD